MWLKYPFFSYTFQNNLFEFLWIRNVGHRWKGGMKSIHLSSCGLYPLGHSNAFDLFHKRFVFFLFRKKKVSKFSCFWSHQNEDRFWFSCPWFSTAVSLYKKCHNAYFSYLQMPSSPFELLSSSLWRNLMIITCVISMLSYFSIIKSNKFS